MLFVLLLPILSLCYGCKVTLVDNVGLRRVAETDCTRELCPRGLYVTPGDTHRLAVREITDVVFVWNRYQSKLSSYRP